jgi:hypothetical protein
VLWLWLWLWMGAMCLATKWRGQGCRAAAAPLPCAGRRQQAPACCTSIGGTNRKGGGRADCFYLSVILQHVPMLRTSHACLRGSAVPRHAGSTACMRCSMPVTLYRHPCPCTAAPIPLPLYRCRYESMAVQPQQRRASDRPRPAPLTGVLGQELGGGEMRRLLEETRSTYGKGGWLHCWHGVAWGGVLAWCRDAVPCSAEGGLWVQHKAPCFGGPSFCLCLRNRLLTEVQPIAALNRCPCHSLSPMLTSPLAACHPQTAYSWPTTSSPSRWPPTPQSLLRSWQHSRHSARLEPSRSPARHKPPPARHPASGSSSATTRSRRAAAADASRGGTSSDGLVAAAAAAGRSSGVRGPLGNAEACPACRCGIECL